MSKHVYVCGYALASLGTHMIVCMCAHVYVGKHGGVCVYVCMNILVLVCVRIYIYGSMYIMHVCPGG